jgi:hypothetical protein
MAQKIMNAPGGGIVMPSELLGQNVIQHGNHHLIENSGVVQQLAIHGGSNWASHIVIVQDGFVHSPLIYNSLHNLGLHTSHDTIIITEPVIVGPCAGHNQAIILSSGRDTLAQNIRQHSANT